ncbi:MAG: DUF1697 domain-containing protein [Burkholderiaceae bacterium]
MSKTYVALLRGINVGRANRIPMAGLRSMVADLGCEDVTSLLNSGNLIFRDAGRRPARLAALIRHAIDQRYGLEVPVIVLSGEDWHKIAQTNPLGEVMTDPSRLLVAFAAQSSDLDAARGIADEQWAPDAIAITDKSAYVWCDAGVLKSPLMKAFVRKTGNLVTARNWTTVQKLQSRLVLSQL